MHYEEFASFCRAQHRRFSLATLSASTFLQLCCQLLSFIRSLSAVLYHTIYNSLINQVTASRSKAGNKISGMLVSGWVGDKCLWGNHNSARINGGFYVYVLIFDETGLSWRSCRLPTESGTNPSQKGRAETKVVGATADTG